MRPKVTVIARGKWWDFSNYIDKIKAISTGNIIIYVYYKPKGAIAKFLLYLQKLYYAIRGK